MIASLIETTTRQEIMKTLKQIAIGEGFYWNGAHYRRTDLECADRSKIIIAGAHGFDQISEDMSVEPDMKPFDVEGF